MLFSTIGQIYIFLWMVGAGLLVGALYSLCSGLRRLLCAGFWLTLLIDTLFGLGAALILIAALVTGSYGRIRMYELLGSVIGLFLFRFGVHPLLVNLTEYTSLAFRHIFARIGRFRLIKVIFK